MISKLTWTVTACLFVVLLTSSISAQTGYQLGSVTGSTLLTTGCPANRGFDAGMTCYTATLSGCPNVAGLNFVYGRENPTGANGTIVLFPGGGGGNASQTPGEEVSYASTYAGKGYQVVQIAWGDASGNGVDWQIYPTTPAIPSTLERRLAAPQHSCIG